MASGIPLKSLRLLPLAACLMAALLPRATAQLDSSWTVKANGQTVQVNDGGGFTLPNLSIPDAFGPDGPGSAPDFVSDEFIVVTGFAIIDGVTTYAYSEPFKIVQGETYLLGDLTISTTPPPFPQSLQIFGSPVVVAIDGYLQLTTRGTLLDGGSMDFTPGTKGTTYRVSNPSIITVNANGLVTGLSRGTAFVTASNNGATAVLRLLVAAGDEVTTVTGVVFSADGEALEGVAVSVPDLLVSGVTSADGSFELAGVSANSGPVAVLAQLTTGAGTFVGVTDPLLPVPGGFTDAGIITPLLVCDQLGAECLDTDGDGVPDALEQSLGLNPALADSNGNQVPDGQEDLDGDGVSTAAEAFLGSAPTGFDSDFDGLNDATEFRYGTNPLVTDTDEDGLTDAEEVNSFHTDPLTPDNQAPVVQVTAPTPVEEMIRGDLLAVSANATDDGRITSAELFLNGVSTGILESAFPFFQTRVPTEGESFLLEVVARDTNGNEGTSGVLQFASLPDPLTNVIGQVVDQEGQPVPEADVLIRAHPGFFELSEADGSFEFTGLPTINGFLAATARLLVGENAFLVGQSLSFPPVRGGTTDVGLITLAPDALTEWFSEGDFDLDNTMLSYTPNAAGTAFSLCVEAADTLPASTEGATPVVFSDDAFLQVQLADGALIPFFGADYSSLFIGSNGYVTFLLGDTTYSESSFGHFLEGRPRISALFDDHDPRRGGTVSYQQLQDRFVVTFDAVAHFSTGGANTFQMEVFFNGVIRFTYLDIMNTGGIVGLSEGLGQPEGFQESDLSTYFLCN